LLLLAALALSQATTARPAAGQPPATVSGSVDSPARLIKNINAGTQASSPEELAVVGNNVYFRADDGVHGQALWKSDGAGATLVKGINLGTGNSYLSQLTAANGTLFFLVNDSETSIEHSRLWRSDGNPAGTVSWQDAIPALSNLSVYELESVDDALFFTSFGAIGSCTLWKTDGTAAGTIVLKANLCAISALTRVRKRLFFLANDTQLWVSDGTAAGTALVKGVAVYADMPGNLVDVDGKLFFTLTSDLWKSDGTAAGSTPLKTLEMRWDYPKSVFTPAGDLVFFNGDDGIIGDELWAMTARAGVDAYAQAPALVGASPGGAAAITVQYSNNGTTMATGAVLTATLSPGLTYLDDTSGISPTVSGRTVVWRLPNIGFQSSRQFSLRVQAPDAPYGSRYPIALTLTASGPDALPADNRRDVVVLIAHQTYLPAVYRENAIYRQNMVR
jgi:uncharacterized repeat protein (TIGR01451 family)